MRWEYLTHKQEAGGFLGGKIDSVEIQKALNRYGSQGWELVSAFDTSVYQGSTRDIIMIFKRPLHPAARSGH